MRRPSPQDLATRPLNHTAAGTAFNHTPASVNIVNTPQRVLEQSEAGNNWTPFGRVQPAPYEGGWDELHGRIMHVSHADLYDSAPCPWPNNGQYDRPVSIGLLGVLLRLKPTTSAHPGASMSTKRGDPASLFNQPPAYSTQMVPIPALGL